MLILLLENPSDDSVEMAVEFCKEVGAFLQDVAPAGLHSVFERFRAILHEGAIDKRCQYMIEGLFAVRKVWTDVALANLQGVVASHTAWGPCFHHTKQTHS